MLLIPQPSFFAALIIETAKFAKYGAKLVLVARGERVHELAARLKEQGTEVIGVQADVSKKVEMEKLAKTVIDTFGTIELP